jgi:hypothetical protein
MEELPIDSKNSKSKPLYIGLTKAPDYIEKKGSVDQDGRSDTQYIEDLRNYLEELYKQESAESRMTTHEIDPKILDGVYLYLIQKLIGEERKGEFKYETKLEKVGDLRYEKKNLKRDQGFLQELHDLQHGYFENYSNEIQSDGKKIMQVIRNIAFYMGRIMVNSESWSVLFASDLTNLGDKFDYRRFQKILSEKPAAAIRLAISAIEKKYLQEGEEGDEFTIIKLAEQLEKIYQFAIEKKFFPVKYYKDSKGSVEAKGSPSIPYRATLETEEEGKRLAVLRSSAGKTSESNRNTSKSENGDNGISSPTTINISTEGFDSYPLLKELFERPFNNRFSQEDIAIIEHLINDIKKCIQSLDEQDKEGDSGYSILEMKSILVVKPGFEKSFQEACKIYREIILKKEGLGSNKRILLSVIKTLSKDENIIGLLSRDELEPKKGFELLMRICILVSILYSVPEQGSWDGSNMLRELLVVNRSLPFLLNDTSTLRNLIKAHGKTQEKDKDHQSLAFGNLFILYGIANLTTMISIHEPDKNQLSNTANKDNHQITNVQLSYQNIKKSASRYKDILESSALYLSDHYKIFKQSILILKELRKFYKEDKVLYRKVSACISDLDDSLLGNITSKQPLIDLNNISRLNSANGSKYSSTVLDLKVKLLFISILDLVAINYLVTIDSETRSKKKTPTYEAIPLFDKSTFEIWLETKHKNSPLMIASPSVQKKTLALNKINRLIKDSIVRLKAEGAEVTPMDSIWTEVEGVYKNLGKDTETAIQEYSKDEVLGNLGAAILFETINNSNIDKTELAMERKAESDNLKALLLHYLYISQLKLDPAAETDNGISNFVELKQLYGVS